MARKTQETLTEGALAPALDVITDTGDQINMADIYKKGPVLVYFYIKADTPGCTAQACNLRDDMSALNAAGLSIVGVSPDTVEDQAAFKEKYKLGFMLIADEKRELANAFGVQGRQSFLIIDGKIAWRQLKAAPQTQSQEVMKALENL